MPPAPPLPDLGPLLAACRGLAAHQLTLFGSALRLPLAEVGDLDLHLVLPHLDEATFAGLAAAARQTAERLAGPLGRPWLVELRHGPFKPAPASPRPLQVHLLVDDQASLARAPSLLLQQRWATGKVVAGELEARPPLPGDPATLLAEARRELGRWHEAVANAWIPCRQWLFEPTARLADGNQPAAGAWDLVCLSRAAATASDLHCLPFAWSAPAAMDVDRGRTISWLAPELEPWQTLAERWPKVRELLLASLASRLSRLAQTSC